MVHLYNAWLPSPIAEHVQEETELFSTVLQNVKSTWASDKPNSAFATLKWIPIFHNFIEAKSEISMDDVKDLVETGLDVFFDSQKHLDVQVRWGNLIARFLKKFGKNLQIPLNWRPFYDNLILVHFERHQNADGFKPRQHHLEAITSLISSCRCFFPAGSAAEIWREFRPLMENLWHNSSLEAVGFVQLFLPTNDVNSDFFTCDWVKDCLKLWIGMPNCQFWDFQWAALMARCIKKCRAVDWEDFLPNLFTHFLNVIEVPIANNSPSFPYSRNDVPRRVMSAFCSSRLVTPSKEIAKSIVYLLKPGGSAQSFFEKLVCLLEQYYHPSNGGRWSYSLERFLRYLVYYFKKRLTEEHCKKNHDIGGAENALRSPEREAFVKTVLKLIERGQYSKNESLSKTSAVAVSVLCFIEPTIILPFIISSFHIAVDNVTSPHQYKSATLMLAFASRALILFSCGASDSEALKLETGPSVDDCRRVLASCMCNTLSGLDVNDPPKTTATMQLLGSMFSSLAEVGDNLMILGVDMSEWLDEFFGRLFSLLLHLEPTSQSNEGQFLSSSPGTFLVENGPFYFCLVEILLGRLSVSLYQQALKKISKFVHGHILPGAVEEVGLLCSLTLYSNPKEAFGTLLQPMITSVIASLKESPSTGFAGENLSFKSSANEMTLSPALEESVEYQLNVLSIAINYAGQIVCQYKKELNQVIQAAFNAPSWKVNKAGNHLLRSLIGCLILYYPLDENKCDIAYPGFGVLEKWISTKSVDDSGDLVGPVWHIPNDDEITFANELLDIHLGSALGKLKDICEANQNVSPGYIKKLLKVILLQIDASLQGAQSCLPDFHPEVKDAPDASNGRFLACIIGSSGASIGDTGLRAHAADVLGQACRFMLEYVSDNSTLLMLLVHILDALVNYGSLEYDEWLGHKQTWKTDSSSITEPPINFLTGQHAQSKHRPRWAVINMSYIHNMWRSSQASYHKFRVNNNLCPSEHVVKLMKDLLSLSLNDYDTVRRLASKSLIKLLKRIPSLIKDCIPKLIHGLQDPQTSENAIIGTCKMLASRVVMRNIMNDWDSFSSFLLSILRSSCHDTLRCQKAINELFLLFNVRFTGAPQRRCQFSSDSIDEHKYVQLIARVKSSIDEMHGMNWRYNLMAHRMIFLLAFPSNGNSISTVVQNDIASHFLLHLRSHLPPVRVLSAASLVSLLQSCDSKESYQIANSCRTFSSSFDGAVPSVIEESTLTEMLNGLSYDHKFTDDNSNRSQNMQDSTLYGWLQAFYAPWPRSRNWNNLLKGDAFLPIIAKLFKYIVKEFGQTTLQLLQKPLEDFVTVEEPGKQCVASEVLAGILHSDASIVMEAWDKWVYNVLQKGLHHSTVETTADWAAGVRFAATGKGRDGKRTPLMRQKVIEFLAEPLPPMVSTWMIAKRFTLLCSVLLEIHPPSASCPEMVTQEKLLNEVLSCMDHSVAQVRESVGDLLAVLVSNLCLSQSVLENASATTEKFNWSTLVMEKAAESSHKIHNGGQSCCNGQSLFSKEIRIENREQEQSIKWMETVFNFVISALKSGRATILSDVILGLLYHIISYQETSHKELSNLAKTALHLLGWQIIPQPNVSNAIDVIVSSCQDPSWHTRHSTLKFLQSFMFRHVFLLTNSEAEIVWNQICNLLKDNHIEVREQAASVLSGLIRTADQNLVEIFHKDTHKEATLLQKKLNSRNSKASMALPTRHGIVLAVASLVLSVPYDMPSWLPDTVTLLAQFIGEPYPIKSTVMKTISEFRRTHADTWAMQKEMFSEEQLEVLADFSSSLSYFS